MNPYKEAWMVHAGMISAHHSNDIFRVANQQENLVKDYVIPTIMMNIPYVRTAYTIYSVVDWLLD